MPGFVGLPEIVLLGLVALLVFGPKRLPEMGRSMGRGLREFKDSVSGDKQDEHDPFAIPEETEVAAATPAQPAQLVPRAPGAPFSTRAPSHVESEKERVA